MSILSKSLASVAFLAALALAGCSGALLEASGKLEPASGKTAPASAAVEVYWEVSSGADYTYGFGAGTATATGFDLSFDADPPAEALNAGGIGVGFVLLMPSGHELQAGKLTEATGEAVFGAAIGAAGRHAIIFKKAGATSPSWASAFPDGYSCAKSVPAAAGETFDTFAPVDCAEVVVTAGDPAAIGFPNWT